MANSIHEPIGKQSSYPQLVAGYGKHHTNKYGDVLPTLTEEQILDMVDNPQAIEKDKAMWVIPSTLASRVHADQVQDGEFWMLWADLDTSPPKLQITFGLLIEALGDINLEVYASNSAKLDYQKSRILIPLNKPISGKQFVACQTLLNKVFIANGISPDMRNQGAGQVCYLPNRGEFYDSESNREKEYFDPLQYWGDLVNQYAPSERSFESPPLSDQAIENAKTILDLIKASGLYKQSLGDGVHDMTCPWVDQHTDAKNSGTAFFEPSDKNNNIGGFSCLHEHCSDKKIGKLLRYLEEFSGRRNIVSGDACSDFTDPETGEILPKKKVEVNRTDPMELLMSMKVTDKIIDNIADARFAYKKLIVEGHLIAICAKANGGKTTIMSFIAGEMVKSGYTVLYINADASASDIKQYAIEANEAGYELLSPDLTNFPAEKVVETLKKLSLSTSDYGRVVIILDTLKKFSDLMHKNKAKEFNSILRALTAKGITVIALAHTNKYDGEDGKPVFEGTGDLRNDFDELIYLIPDKTADGSMTVATEADKVRAGVLNYTFTISPNREVRLLDHYVDTLAIVNEKKAMAEDMEIFQVVNHHIKDLSKSKAELLELIKSAEITISRKKLEKVMDRYCQGTAHDPQWRVVPGFTNGVRYLRVISDFMEKK